MTTLVANTSGSEGNLMQQDAVRLETLMFGSKGSDGQVFVEADRVPD
jgi:hypothetical protein